MTRILHPHLAFTINYPGRVRELCTAVKVGLPSLTGEFVKNKPFAEFSRAIWDTGATNTVITKTVVVVFLEIKAYLDYERLDLPLTFWRSQTKLEVDFLMGDSVAIEVKGAEHVSDADLKGLRALAEERKLIRKVVVSRESAPRTTNDAIEIWPIAPFLEALWAGEFKETA